MRWKRETLQEMKRYRKEVEEKEEQKHVLSTKLHLVQSEVQNLKRDKNASVNALNAEMQLSAKLNQQVCVAPAGRQPTAPREKYWARKTQQRGARAAHQTRCA